MAPPQPVEVEAQPQREGAWYKQGAIPLGSCIGGISIYLHWSFFALLGIMLISTLLSNASDGNYWLLIILLYGPILLVTIILHEFGHAFMTKALGGQVGDMVLWPLGGFVICGPTETVAGDFYVAIAGPLTHIPQCLVWFGIFAAVEGGNFENFGRFYDSDMDFGAALTSQAFYLNVVLFIFNLFVPAYPLDGGRCLAAGLVLCGLSVLNAAMATAIIGMVIAMAFAVWGIFDFINGSPTGIFTAAMGAWIFMSSYGLFKLTRPASGVYGEVTDNLKSHPVFGQECYQNRARGENNNTSGSNNA
ncbi:Peptidase family M50 [Seminavis robusta]|uniref:Peptidase family M50 n=1 Tax=Seminavis robusta TaxID=568900 RepID=A0A9N8EHE0_9STRA|nr:Peptidase family M50 [Seminavis robusta]|eukprot:Sro1008_g230530.1 Peptidase family M50 (304) ;mRNA; f:15821-16983